MKIIDIEIGSPEWEVLRSRTGSRPSSEAPIIMGCGRITRQQLIRQKATGDSPEYSAWVKEVLFERGHQAEALARPHAEVFIGEELVPMMGTTDDEYMAATFDGITMGLDTVWECKLLNQDKANELSLGPNVVPKIDYWQCIHHLVVSGAQRCVYQLSDGTMEGSLFAELSANDPDVLMDMGKLVANWQQFDKDLAAYVPEVAPAEVIGRAPEQLPALIITVKGGVQTSNLDQFKEQALAVLRGINRQLDTDEDFADAAKTVTWCEGVEKKLEATKMAILEQTQSIDEVFRTMDAIKEECRTVRLQLNKDVEARKKSIRAEIVNEANAALLAHFDDVNAGLPGWASINAREVNVDFAAAMKGKKSITSLRDGVAHALANAKIQIGKISSEIHANLKAIAELEADYIATGHRDMSVLIRQTHCKDVMEARITTHKADQKRKEDELLEAERARIRKEEEDKAAAALEVEKKRLAAEAETERQRLADEAAEAARIAREDDRKRNTEAMIKGQADAKTEPKQEQTTPRMTTVMLPGERPTTAGSVQPVAPSPTVVIMSEDFDHEVPAALDIVNLVAGHYRVPVGTAIDWLVTYDFVLLSEAMSDYDKLPAEIAR